MDDVDRIIAQWAVERPELATLPMAVFGRVFRIAKLGGERAEQAYAEFGIGRGEFDVLATLRRSGDPYRLTPGRLSATLMLTTGGMTGRLDKLERAGLVSRSPDPADRRGQLVTLTERGLSIVDEAVVKGLDVQREALAEFSEADREQLADLLRRLLAAIG
ncbi:MarR family transcriptional regulator [Kutzneria viridogrisea]|uniref:HTH marR-type domain-containing protein n=2 Tax=Kutzneria TaxID=43356 RepID=W5VZG6_9PSEU|nr:MarR family transcriptional regulator [Kutzneria albida]AHH93656.1 hypothetical protein KALB_279 [Kutzneria albida DSM 43870]MBA8931340.1 DNA-binding MarR family transcriptional regulator [Kutzneria viridogrisea]